jgi:hypothetical protein
MQPAYAGEIGVGNLDTYAWLAQQKTERAPKVFSYCERCGGPVHTPPRVCATDFRRGAAGDPQTESHV